jgi:hypothetical protein
MTINRDLNNGHMNDAGSNFLQIQFAPPNADACGALAQQHRTTLPTSVLSARREKFLTTFYRFASQGTSSALIKRSDRHLEAPEVARNFVPTSEEPDNEPLNFYSRHGFAAAGWLDAHRVRLFLLMKGPPPSAVTGPTQ